MQIAARKTLQGLRVLEIGHFVAAPFATRLLADQGADVIKIEPLEGDPARQWGRQIDGKSLWWSAHARGKRCITLNLKDPRARDAVLDLVAQSDAVIENFRPGQLERLGLGPDILRAKRPGLVIARISGYGQTGPYRDRAAFGVIGEALGGLRYLTNHAPGTTDLPPVRVGVSIGDSIAGLYAAFGVMAALWQRDRSDGDGVGRTLDIALTESVLSMMEGMLPEYDALGIVKQPTGGGIATAAPSNAYRTRDGWVLIAANSNPLFARLMALMDRPDLIDEPAYAGNATRVAHAEELDRLIGEWTLSFTSQQLLERLEAADIPSAKAYTAADCAQDEQYRFRGAVRGIFDPAFDREILHCGIVPQVVEDDAALPLPGPAIGADNEAILGDLLGYSDEKLAILRAEGVIA